MFGSLVVLFVDVHRELRETDLKTFYHYRHPGRLSIPSSTLDSRPQTPFLQLPFSLLHFSIPLFSGYARYFKKYKLFPSGSFSPTNRAPQSWSAGSP